jgi:hypothetical protein
VQEYLTINAPILRAITVMGSDSATLADAARSWLEIDAHFQSLEPCALTRLSCTPAQDLAQLQALSSKRVADGLKDPLYLALLLDPGPSHRAFVQSSGVMGSAADHTLGNTTALAAAARALQTMSEAITVEGRKNHQRGQGCAHKALLVCCEACSIFNVSFWLFITFMPRVRCG